MWQWQVPLVQLRRAQHGFQVVGVEGPRLLNEMAAPHRAIFIDCDRPLARETRFAEALVIAVIQIKIADQSGAEIRDRRASNNPARACKR